jgi:flagellar biosynthesis/type III secretory pathway ATPase
MNKDNMEISTVVALLVIVIIILIAAVIMLMRYQEHTAALYERRMEANARVISALRDRDVLIDVYADGSMSISPSTVATEQARVTAAAPNAPSELLDALEIVKMSMSDPQYLEKNQILPANRYSSGERWQAAINVMRERGWLLDIKRGNRVGTFTAPGVTLSDLIGKITDAIVNARLTNAVNALPLASRKPAGEPSNPTPPPAPAGTNGKNAVRGTVGTAE